MQSKTNSDWTIATNEHDPETLHISYRGKPIIQGYRDSKSNQVVIVLCAQDNLAHGGYFFVPFKETEYEEPDPDETPEERTRQPWIHYRLVGPPALHVPTKEPKEKRPKAQCTNCGKVRIIEYVCLSGMDDANPDTKTKKLELCRKCTTKKKNWCKHELCRANYEDRLDP